MVGTGDYLRKRFSARDYLKVLAAAATIWKPAGSASSLGTAA
jgi:hypothetical protein